MEPNTNDKITLREVARLEDFLRSVAPRDGREAVQ
jgi:hypothetical protein